MKLLSAFLVFSFFFFIGCGDGGVTRVVEEEKQETVNDNDPTNPTDDPTNPTDDPTNPTDDPTNPTDDPTNPTDDPTNPTDDPTNPTDDPTNPTDDPTNPTDDPTNPTDDPTNPTDDPTNPTDDPTNPTDDPTNPTDPTDPTDPTTPLTDAEKCTNAGGTWNSSAKKCYKTVSCDGKPANSTWNGDSSYKIYYDVNAGVWEPLAYATEYGDGEPQPCQYVCDANYGPKDDLCKPLCSAKFNGTNSMITIASEDAPTIVGLDSWTIEAWVKQSADELPTYQIYPILRKGTETSHPEYLLSGYYNGNNGYGYGLTASTYYSYQQYGNQTRTGDNQVNATFNTFPEGWSHVAMVYSQETNQYGGGGWTTYKLTVFINGEQVKSGNFSGAPTFIPNDEPLVFGVRNSDRYFTGLIDSIKFSDAALYTENFEPAKLSADDNTIAFWDFSNNANDSVSGITGTPSNIEYSADCKE